MPEEKYGIEDFLQEYKEPVGKIITAVATNIEEEKRIKLKAMKYVFTVVLVIFGTLSILTYQGAIGGEALIFLAGSITGYLFAFLHRYIIGIT